MRLDRVRLQAAECSRTSLGNPVCATDDFDPSPDVVCIPPSGSVFPRGTTIVTCAAKDDAGNQATSAFPVTVTLKVRQRGL